MAVISSQQNNSYQSLFGKNNQTVLSFVFAVLLSIGCMISDSYFNSLHSVRNLFSVLVAPVQYAVDYPLQMIEWTHSLVRSKKQLINENIRLRYQQTMIEAKLQKYIQLQSENSQLRELLAAYNDEKMKAIAAEILAVQTTNSRQLLVLNKGSREGAFVGQPVLDAKGVMGQIIDVGLMTSTVLLISDSKSAVPVRNDRTGERAILVGNNDMGELLLINLPKSSSIQHGDLLVTSGLGRLYPEGYPVGRVSTVINRPGDDFIQVAVSPVALLNRSRLVLLIWPEYEHDMLTAQIDQRLDIIAERLG